MKRIESFNQTAIRELAEALCDLFEECDKCPLEKKLRNGQERLFEMA